MPALATVADLQHVTGTTVDATRAGRLLELASAAAMRYAGRRFARVVNDAVTVTVGSSGRMTLPNGPTVSVASIVDPQGNTIAAAGYELSGSTVTRTYGGWSGYGTWAAGRYTVTYTHGHTPIPDDVILAVCQIVGRHLTNSDGVRSESIGEAATVYAIPGTGVALALTVGPAERDLLDPYRIPGYPVSMRPSLAGSE